MRRWLIDELGWVVRGVNDLPVYNVFVDFGGGEVRVVYSGWFVGACVLVR